jgi:hypothetical protein
MPPFPSFEDAASYYGALLHEMTHWTRHESRLDRELGGKKWGDAGYAMEELVAEVAAAFLCADLGITPEVREVSPRGDRHEPAPPHRFPVVVLWIDHLALIGTLGLAVVHLPGFFA